MKRVLYIVSDMLQAGGAWVRPVHVRKTKMAHSTMQQEVAECTEKSLGRLRAGYEEVYGKAEEAL